MVEVNYINDQDKCVIPEEIEPLLENLIMRVVEHEELDKFCEVSVLFVDNEKIRVMNRDYRNKDAATDVLSFPQYDDVFAETEKEEHVLLGDIVISLERAVEQAEDFGHSLTRELCYLTVHSMFHLFGYDHMTEEDKAIMREREEAVLEAAGITRD
ncbi:MAG: rRNA maturation RNase YbeY [Clostridia bacterium]|nr:rRNA maturation RNase YbeY [Clostridia bacterium]